MDRRSFLGAAGGTAVLSLASPWARAATADVQALLGLLEETPRSQILERVVDRIDAGVRYENLLAALTLATVRNVQPYPDVGFKYHAVMVLQSIHQTTERMPPAERWLPLLWAIDYFKDMQAQERSASGWTLPQRTPEAAVSESQARRALTAALDQWDREAADAAIVQFANAAEPDAVFSVLFQYAARDYRSIGHKAIAAANAHRLLTLLGWEHRAPVLRSLVAAILNHDGEPNPATAELRADAPGRHNLSLLREIPESWANGAVDAAASRELLAALREADAFDASRAVVRELQQGIAPDSIWHALHAAGAELMLTDPRIIALHAQTSTHALHYSFRETRDRTTRLLALLQCASFIPMFRGSIRGRDRLVTLDALEPANVDPTRDLEDVFSVAGGDKRVMITQALGYLERGASAIELMDHVRRQVVATATNSHNYKYAEAVFESYAWMPRSPWRDRHLGAGFVYFNGPGDRANPFVTEARALMSA